MRPKDPLPTEEKSEVVYKIACGECPAYYVGETSKRVSTRVQEHKLAIRRGEQYSQLWSHMMGTGHRFNFNGVEVIASDNTKGGRLLKEAWLSGHDSINRHIDLCQAHATLRAWGESRRLYLKRDNPSGSLQSIDPPGEVLADCPPRGRPGYTSPPHPDGTIQHTYKLHSIDSCLKANRMIQSRDEDTIGCLQLSDGSADVAGISYDGRSARTAYDMTPYERHLPPSIGVEAETRETVDRSHPLEKCTAAAATWRSEGDANALRGTSILGWCPDSPIGINTNAAIMCRPPHKPHMETMRVRPSTHRVRTRSRMRRLRIEERGEGWRHSPLVTGPKGTSDAVWSEAVGAKERTLSPPSTLSPVHPQVERYTNPERARHRYGLTSGSVNPRCIPNAIQPLTRTCRNCISLGNVGSLGTAMDGRSIPPTVLQGTTSVLHSSPTLTSQGEVVKHLIPLTEAITHEKGLGAHAHFGDGLTPRKKCPDTPIDVNTATVTAVSSSAQPSGCKPRLEAMRAQPSLHGMRTRSQTRRLMGEGQRKGLCQPPPVGFKTAGNEPQPGVFGVRKGMLPSPPTSASACNGKKKGRGGEDIDLEKTELIRNSPQAPITPMEECQKIEHFSTHYGASGPCIRGSKGVKHGRDPDSKDLKMNCKTPVNTDRLRPVTRAYLRARKEADCI